MLKDFICKKEILIVGTGVGEKSSKDKFYYANLNSNCMWSVIKKLKWIEEIPKDVFDFENIMRTSKFGFTDLVKDYCGNDNKVLSKYYKLINGKIKINQKYLINKEVLEKDKKQLIDKFKNAKYVILNGKPITKILFGTDKYDYGFILDKKLLNSIGINNSEILYSKNSVIRDANKRIEIENSLFDLYSKIKI